MMRTRCFAALLIGGCGAVRVEPSLEEELVREVLTATAVAFRELASEPLAVPSRAAHIVGLSAPGGSPVLSSLCGDQLWRLLAMAAGDWGS